MIEVVQLNDYRHNMVLVPYEVLFDVDSLLAKRKESNNLQDLISVLDLFLFLESIVLYDTVVFHYLHGRKEDDSAPYRQLPVLGHYFGKQGILKILRWSDPDTGADHLRPVLDRFLDRFIETQSDGSPKSQLQMVDIAEKVLNEGLGVIRPANYAAACAYLRIGGVRTAIDKSVNISIHDKDAKHTIMGNLLVDVSIAEEYGVSYSPSILGIPCFNKVCKSLFGSLKEKVYRELGRRLSDAVSELRDFGCPFQMVVPPIPAVALSRMRAHDIDSLVTEVLALREQFAPYRRKYQRYQEIVSHPEKFELRDVLKAYRQAVNEVVAALRIFDPSDSLLIYDMLNTFLKVSASPTGADPGLSPSLSLSGLLTVLAKQVGKRTIVNRANAIFDLFKKTLRIKDYGNLLSKITSYRPSNADVRLIQKFGEETERCLAAQRYSDFFK
jgi:hypothetical protein